MSVGTDRNEKDFLTSFWIHHRDGERKCEVLELRADLRSLSVNYCRKIEQKRKKLSDGQVSGHFQFQSELTLEFILVTKTIRLGPFILHSESHVLLILQMCKKQLK